MYLFVSSRGTLYAFSFCTRRAWCRACRQTLPSPHVSVHHGPRNVAYIFFFRFGIDAFGVDVASDFAFASRTSSSRAAKLLHAFFILGSTCLVSACRLTLFVSNLYFRLGPRNVAYDYRLTLLASNAPLHLGWRNVTRGFDFFFGLDVFWVGVSLDFARSSYKPLRRRPRERYTRGFDFWAGVGAASDFACAKSTSSSRAAEGLHAFSILGATCLLTGVTSEFFAHKCVSPHLRPRNVAHWGLILS